jgi:hypothetical protein
MTFCVSRRTSSTASPSLLDAELGGAGADELAPRGAAGLVARAAAARTARVVVLDLVGEGELQRVGIELHADLLAFAFRQFLQVLVEFDQARLAALGFGHGLRPPCRA